MLDEFDRDMSTWGYLTSCNWPDLSLDEAEAMVLTDSIFGGGDSSINVRISITCNDGNATVYYDPENYTWVFER